jgi:hypothetical protein
VRFFVFSILTAKTLQRKESNNLAFLRLCGEKKTKKYPENLRPGK